MNYPRYPFNNDYVNVGNKYINNPWKSYDINRIVYQDRSEIFRRNLDTEKNLLCKKDIFISQKEQELKEKVNESKQCPICRTAITNIIKVYD